MYPDPMYSPKFPQLMSRDLMSRGLISRDLISLDPARLSVSAVTSLNRGAFQPKPGLHRVLFCLWFALLMLTSGAGEALGAGAAGGRSLRRQGAHHAAQRRRLDR